MLRHVAGVPEDRAVHRRGVVERELVAAAVVRGPLRDTYSLLLPSRVALLSFLNRKR